MLILSTISFAMRRVLLFFILLFIPFFSTAQYKTTEFEASGWRMGFNIGAAYQGKPFGEKDLEPSSGIGLGFTMGHMLYQEPGAFFNLGIRGRLLWEMTKGISTQRSYAIGVHPGSSSDKRYDLDIVGQRYQDTVGYVYPNYRQEGRQYDLELMLGFNRFAERHDVLFYLFGGIGVINYQVRTDQLDENGEIYRYGDLGPDPSKDEIRRLKDGQYETPVYEGGKIDRFISSAGVGVLYHISPRIGIGLEHKVSFPDNEDRFDGKEFQNGRDPEYERGDPGKVYDEFHQTERQDLYHYTALRLQWRMGETESDEPGNVLTKGSGIDEKEDRTFLKAPVVEILRPNSSPYRSSSDSLHLVAQVERVEGKDDLKVLVDGEDRRSFRFDRGKRTLKMKMALKGEDERIIVKGVNEAGSDADRVLILPEERGMGPPELWITRPEDRTSTTYRNEQALEAKVFKVNEKSRISFRTNGSEQAFSFDSVSGTIEADLDLIQGANRVELSAWNDSGRVSGERIILFKKEARPAPPRVRIVHPEQDPYTVHHTKVTLRAELEGVKTREEVRVVHNGKELDGFGFDSQKGELRVRLSLDQGENILRIRVKNPSGSDRAEQRVLLRKEELEAPEVEFEAPATSGKTVRDPYFQVSGNIDNVRGRGQISFRMNGAAGASYSFDPDKGSFRSGVRLEPGENRFSIEAVNASGMDQEERSLFYRPEGKGEAPSLKIREPSKDPSSTTKKKATIRVRVEHVPDRKGLSVRFNGEKVSDLSYDPEKGVLVIKEPLIEGRNQFTFRADNAYGTAKTAQTVIYSPKKAPVVKIIDPVKKKTVHAPTYAIQAKVLRVSDASDLTFKVNQKPVEPFKFDPKSGKFLGSTDLQKGNNEVVLIGKNATDTDRDERSIRYEPASPPSVTFTVPSNDPYKTAQSKVVVKGKVEGIENRKDLFLTANGKQVQQFQFSGSGSFKFEMQLQPGKNRCVAKVKNPAGQADDDLVIERSKSERDADGDESDEGGDEGLSERPSVTIEKPRSNETTVDGVRVEADVDNATSVELYVNGSEHDHERTSSGIGADVRLREGKNTIRVEVSNEAGSASDEVSIRFTPVREEEKKKEPEKGDADENIEKGPLKKEGPSKEKDDKDEKDQE